MRRSCKNSEAAKVCDRYLELCDTDAFNQPMQLRNNTVRFKPIVQLSYEGFGSPVPSRAEPSVRAPECRKNRRHKELVDEVASAICRAVGEGSNLSCSRGRER